MSRKLLMAFVACLVVSPGTLLAQRLAPTMVFAFSVPGVGSGTAFFKSVGGLSSETDVTEFREGGAPPNTVQKIPGNLHFGDVTLKRPVTSDVSLAQWRKLVEDGQVQQARKNATLILYDRSNKELARWAFVRAWPSKLAIEVDPDTGDVLEVLKVAVDGIVRQ